MASRFLPYAHQSIDSSDIQEVSKALISDFITRGPTVEAFEQSIADYCGAKYAVAFNNATSGLIATCYAAKLGPNDRVITSPNTFVASVICAMQFDAIPVFVDIDLDTGNLNLTQVEHNLKEQKSTRGKTAVIPIHFSGIPVDMQKLDSMICDPDTIVIEDAAHALGSSYADGQKVGCCAWSHMTVFSFHPAKTITTGEGGMVLTNDEELYKRLRSFRNNCIERDQANFKSDASVWYEGFYEATDISGNYNFTDIQAALGVSQFRRLGSFVEKRRQLIKEYRRLFKDMPHVKMLTDAYDESVAFVLCVVQIDYAAYNTTRAAVMSYLKERGIGTQMHYIPVYQHPFFKDKCGDISAYFPNMETYYAQALSLPLFYDLQLDEVEYVVKSLKEILDTEKQKKPIHKEKEGQQRPHSRNSRSRNRRN